MEMSRRDQLTILFLLVAISAAALNVMGTVNYLRFYPTLTKLQLDMTSFQWNNTGEAIEITASFLIRNLGNYDGLNLKSFEGVFNIQLSPTVTMSQGSIPFKRLTGPLDPGGTVSTSYKFNSTAEAARRVRETIDSGGEVKFIFEIDMILLTFLESYTGVSAFYLCEASQGPGTCEQRFITLTTKIEQGGGGGGGGA